MSLKEQITEAYQTIKNLMEAPDVNQNAVDFLRDTLRINVGAGAVLAPSPDPGEDPGGEDPGGEDPEPSTTIWGISNGERARLKLWTPYNRNGVIQKNAKDRLIMLEAFNEADGSKLALQSTDKFVLYDAVRDGDSVAGMLLNADSGSDFKDFWRISFFRDEDGFADKYLKDTGMGVYPTIKPIFYVPVDLVKVL